MCIICTVFALETFVISCSKKQLFMAGLYVYISVSSWLICACLIGLCFYFSLILLYQLFCYCTVLFAVILFVTSWMPTIACIAVLLSLNTHKEGGFSFGVTLTSCRSPPIRPVEGRLSELFYAALCITFVHIDMYTCWHFVCFISVLTKAFCCCCALIALVAFTLVSLVGLLSGSQVSISHVIHGLCWTVSGQVKVHVMHTCTNGLSPVSFLWFWPAIDHEPHCWHVPTNKICGRTDDDVVMWLESTATAALAIWKY